MDEDKKKQAAADLIRKKIEAVYTNGSPDITSSAAQQPKPSKHHQFIEELTASGKPIEEIQVAWHDYYQRLSDEQKHQVWQEYYATRGQTYSPAAKLAIAVPLAKRKLQSRLEILTRALTTPKTATQPKKERPAAKHVSPWRSLTFGLAAGSIVLIVVMFSFFNERFIAPFIQPSRSISNVPLISGATIGQNPEIIIPKINVEIPVVYGVKTIDEEAVMKALEGGVVHYADTALPGENGNTVIVGHSSNNIFNRGKYKFAFVLLNRLELGDTFYLQKDGKRYTYQIYQKKIVKPNDVSVLGLSDKPAVATLITCDPPGTSANRLVVVGEQISPDPAKNRKSASTNSLAQKAGVVPSNAKTLWTRIWEGLSR